MIAIECIEANNTYERDTIKGGKALTGRKTYTFTASTHWSDVCQVVQDYSRVWRDGDKPEISMHYGAGGVNNGTSPTDLAMALSMVFKQAHELITKLENEQ